MRLYHFTSAKYGLEAIRNRRLKISRINELNDPFEILAPQIADRNTRQVFDLFKGEMSRRFGIICMSDTWKHPLLWGHYGDKHAGICLGFDTADNAMFSKVKYVSKRPTLASLGMIDGKMTEPAMKSLLRLKFDAWSYEREYRAFAELETDENGLFFGAFEPILTLREVILGVRCDAEFSDVESAVADLTNVRCFKSELAIKKFEIVAKA